MPGRRFRQHLGHPDSEPAIDGHDFPSCNQRAIYVDVEKLVGLAVELDHRSLAKLHDFGEAQKAAGTMKAATASPVLAAALERGLELGVEVGVEN